MNRQPPHSPIDRQRRAAARRRAKRRQMTVQIALIVFILALVCAMIFLVSLALQKGSSAEETLPYQSQPMTSEPIGDETEMPSDTDVFAGQTEASTETQAPRYPFDVPQITFTADLSAYEQYMNPQGEQRDAYLMLVNAEHPLSKNYYPKDLVSVKNSRYGSWVKLERPAAMAMEAMFAEANALGHLNNSTGYVMSVTSAYRDYNSQSTNYEAQVQKWMNTGMSRADAEIEAAKTVCPPGQSEHQSGLAADLHNQYQADSSNPQAFANSPEGQWIHENCWKFGFVLRFPEDKTEITGIKYESWHFRYVGRYHAYQMTQLNMCLEEYVAYLEVQGLSLE